ncbi:hypothetical protein EIP86_000869 [Pleurotus ostreatoroseus]|nr:hypothetical protein EIP86_000869 [Pleurotus ostreatoroseus]
MFLSTRQSPRRRRSHSAASPVAGPSARRAHDDKSRTALKRPRPANLRTPSYKDLASDPAASQKWDLDRWRKGKRARRDSAVSPHSAPCSTEADPRPPLQSPAPTSRGPCLFGSSSVFRNELGPLPPPGLPSTSAAFDFFPARARQAHAPSPAAPCPDSRHEGPSSSTPADVSRLRSEAFGELQRSIAENGEGLLTRMRDWEAARCARSPLDLERAPQTQAQAQACPDDDDDVQIVSASGPHCAPALPSAPTTRKARAWSMSDVDVDIDIDTDMDVDGPDGLSRCSSPYIDGDEDDAPALSYTRTNSTNSSLVSLPLPLTVPAPASVPQPISHPHPSSHPHSHSHPYAPAQGYAHPPSSPAGAPASPSEKALAALMLVMANGAGGLNDYAAVRAAAASASLDGAALDAAHVGEMWD